MTPSLEKVARAICFRALARTAWEHARARGEVTSDDAILAVVEETWRDYLPDARAALNRLIPPSPEMVDKVATAICYALECHGFYVGDEVRRALSDAAVTAAIRSITEGEG